MKAGEGSPLCTEYVTTGTMIGIKKITNLRNLRKHNWEEKSYNGKRDLGQESLLVKSPDQASWRKSSIFAASWEI